jgi:hypothetical protein
MQHDLESSAQLFCNFKRVMAKWTCIKVYKLFEIKKNSIFKCAVNIVSYWLQSFAYEVNVDGIQMFPVSLLEN